ncbi:MAG: branched-chain amino acid ABC transporter permease [Alphaproteobacteria bacterium]|nr:MAG: branched-chain amino acid ABC transporter permease [Alphaproteobacteria bacterium]
MARRAILATAAVVGLILPLAATASGQEYLIGVATRILILALAGLSLNLILGYGGMVSFGHAAFFGVGAYAVAILAYHDTMGEPVLTWPIELAGTQSAFVAWPAAMLISALFALVVGAISLRTGGLYFIMITLAFAQMLFFFFVGLETYGGDDGLSLWARSSAGPLDLGDPATFYYLTLGLVALVLGFKARLVAARFGLALQGIRDNEQRMRALGFATLRYKLAAFVLAGAVAGLAGALMANHSEFVSPALLSWQRSGEMLVIVILGGMGTVYGPVAGAIVFFTLEELLSQWTTHWMIVLGPLLVLVVLYAKRGLWGLVEDASRARPLPGKEERRGEPAS